MTAVHHDSRVSRLARRALRLALRVAFYCTFYVGSFLFFVPFWHVFDHANSFVSQKRYSVMGGVVVVVALALGLILLGIWLRERLIDLQQGENDCSALRIMSELRADAGAAVAEFYLYLRAFETTGKLRIPLYLRLRKLMGPRLFRLQTNDLESYVSSAVRRAAPLIALGQPGEAIGAGRIVTQDKNWQDDIVVLMKRAKAILLVPSNRPGTLWEINTVKREGLLNKVVFIMPPRTKGEFDTKERWQVARQVMASYGLESPDHQDRGLLFNMGPDGRVTNVEPLLVNTVRQVRKSLQRILSDTPPKGGLSKAIAAADKRSQRTTFWGWAYTMSLFWALPYAVVSMALFPGHPSIGFNPSESWTTVWDRRMTASAIFGYELAENIKLAKSEKYRIIEAQTPKKKLGDLKQLLFLRGLLRLENDAAKAVYIAFGDMLARADTNRCAAIARGETEMMIAFTYIPPERIHRFLDARTAAILAEVEDAPVPAIYKVTAAQAKQQFLVNLGPEGQRRYKRIDKAQGKLSDDDQCWLARAMFSSVARFSHPVSILDFLHGGESLRENMAAKDRIQNAMVREALDDWLHCWKMRVPLD